MDQALDYYKKNLVEKDPRKSDYMTNFKLWLAVYKNDSIPQEFSQHMKVLNSVSEVYEEFFWLSHKKGCLQVLDDNMPLIRKTENRFVDSITTLTFSTTGFIV